MTAAIPFPDPLTFWLVAARLGGAVMLAPGLAALTVPRQVRALLVLWLALLLTPTVGAAAGPVAGLWDVAALVGLELAVGLSFGLALRLVLAVIELGGTLIDQELGFLSASQFNPMLGTSGGLVTGLWVWIAVAYFWLLDYASLTLAAVHRSFEVVPAGAAALALSGPAEGLIALGAGIFAGALTVAAPVIALAFVVTVAIGLVARAVQGLNIFFENFTLRLIVVGAALVVFLPLLLALVRHQLAAVVPLAAGWFVPLPTGGTGA